MQPGWWSWTEGAGFAGLADGSAVAREVDRRYRWHGRPGVAVGTFDARARVDARALSGRFRVGVRLRGPARRRCRSGTVAFRLDARRG